MECSGRPFASCSSAGEAAVARDGDDFPIGIKKLGADGAGQRECH
jgi:hypothetical protein